MAPFDATRTVREREEDAETLRAIPVSHPETPFLIGPVVGTGGTSEVREARQQALFRNVALKRIARRPTSRTDERLLLREAWVTGALEHPNIVPVHDIWFDRNEPVIVMKRIEGVPWIDVMDRPADQGSADASTQDALAWNLGVLVQVCHAVEFAHSRRILHRDLKPENVMIGSFGEVVVLDWGLAVALEDRYGGRVPLARDHKGISGTPAYMAPEMAGGDGLALDERTDVYLLGGVLHRIVAGRPPRTGKTLGGLVAAVQWEEIAVDPSWPLADLLRRALSRDPAHRPESAAALRLEVQRFLEERASGRMLTVAWSALQELEAAIADGEPRDQVYGRFGACRFTFERALERSPDVEEARMGLQRAVEAVAWFEVEQDDDRSASALVAQLPRPSRDLEARIEELARLREEEGVRLQQLEEEVDPLSGTRPRMLALLAAGVAWVGPPVVGTLAGIPAGYPLETFISGTTSLATLVILGASWPFLRRSRINRALLAAMALSPYLAVILLLACWLAGVPDLEAAALRTFAFVCTATFAGVLGDLRILPSSLGYVLALGVGVVWPSTSAVALALANGLLVVNGLVVWAPGALGLSRR